MANQLSLSLISYRFPYIQKTTIRPTVLIHSLKLPLLLLHGHFKQPTIVLIFCTLIHYHHHQPNYLQQKRTKKLLYRPILFIHSIHCTQSVIIIPRVLNPSSLSFSCNSKLKSPFLSIQGTFKFKTQYHQVL
jgi:hypothetical protein